MHKFLIGLGLTAAIVVENWFWPGLIAFSYRWTIGLSPWYVQAVLLIVACAAIAFAAAEFFGGVIGLPALGIVAILPLLGFRLGWVDDQLGDAARQLANNARDVQEVAQVHYYLHASLVIIIAVAAIAALTALARRVF